MIAVNWFDRVASFCREPLQLVNPPTHPRFALSHALKRKTLNLFANSRPHFIRDAILRQSRQTLR